MNSINLVTQPSNEPISPSKEDILYKLQHLIEENNDREVSESRKESNPKDHGRKSKNAKGDDVKYDQDGFEIPKGKIPLDGNFSTKEIEGLVEIAKEKHLLDENVEVNVVDPNNVVGDKVKISDSPDDEDNEDHD